MSSVIQILFTGRAVRMPGAALAPVLSGIVKRSREGPAMLANTGFQGDEQGDKVFHGGPEQAVQPWRQAGTRRAPEPRVDDGTPAQSAVCRGRRRGRTRWRVGQGRRHPMPATGRLAGGTVFSYVWPTTINPDVVRAQLCAASLRQAKQSIDLAGRSHYALGG